MTAIDRSAQLDDLKIVTLTDGEVWSARDLMTFAGYTNWRKWSGAIDRAIESVNASGLNAADHFAGGVKMVELGSGARREVEDVNLTRYACYILFQNADSRKPEIAALQQYFAVQTRKQELAPTTAPTGAELIALAVVEAQRMLAEKDRQIAELEPRAAHADTFRQADGLRTIGDVANDLKVHALSNYPGVKVLQKDVYDLAGQIGLIIRGDTIRHNQPTARAIEAGWVKPKESVIDTNHGDELKITARLTPKGQGRLWDAAVTNLAQNGVVYVRKETAA
ncbi:phage antirepressor KilAC domain-containing protein [Microbacterium sp. No. 7]|uniref:phage antirepressor KilAC domain-containing protein n=1 Tax=Microbacterium sp. No. 7 TaxID=1714373 RepID=UPI0006D25EEE|nr:phage antirepressor KilAC domain-containing protein [Microbacterium sp. No. 7]